MVARLVRDQEARSSNLRTPTTKAAGASSPAAFVRRVPVVRLRASWRTRRSLVWELRSAAACGRERRDAISAAAPFLGLSLYGEVRERHLRQGGAKRRGPEFKSPHSDHVGAHSARLENSDCKSSRCFLICALWLLLSKSDPLRWAPILFEVNGDDPVNKQAVRSGLLFIMLCCMVRFKASWSRNKSAIIPAFPAMPAARCAGG